MRPREFAGGELVYGNVIPPPWADGLMREPLYFNFYRRARSRRGRASLGPRVITRPLARGVTFRRSPSKSCLEPGASLATQASNCSSLMACQIRKVGWLRRDPAPTVAASSTPRPPASPGPLPRCAPSDGPTRRSGRGIERSLQLLLSLHSWGVEIKEAAASCCSLCFSKLCESH